ncbi:hypothetical protein MBEHAL_0012 [Halarchaeum acidiphilum MH1-52-1]|uniref:N-acetyltransferase domain-containing protein n=1 Tax=Halarchaeum acidiphilum MH1-52-1 TaxID=1261545 RepID=U2YRB0_9EURY|nr:GNAT family N-acetyltransferase [Halarchaeum acidiphilum]GAD51252.1 hypothetical protein MBEHAL_0012 [Halarchaeum acidiphilum MH1-52-1]
MTEDATRAMDDPLRDTPFCRTAADGGRVRIDTADDGDAAALAAMYDAFPPADRTQGLPPARPEDRREWIETLLDARNAVARRDGRIVGHAALLGAGDAHELAVFVAPDARGVGVGTALLCGLLGAHRDRGGGRVWLAVESSNRRARALYRRFDFAIVRRGGVELTMARDI